MRKTKLYLALLACITLTSSVWGQGSAMTEKLKNHVYVLADDSMAGRKTGSVYAAKAAEYIADEFGKTGITPYFNGTYYQEFNPDILVGKSKKEFRNVVGIITGNDPKLKNEYIVVGAHYDHIGIGQNIAGDSIYNGADDNASGIAALIELANRLYNNREMLKRSVILAAFDAEEIGLHGSRYFVDNLDFPIENVKLMISLDMIGWYKASQTLYYYGTGTLKDSKSVFSQPAAEALGLNISTEKFETKLGVATDTEPFAVRGIPTFYITTGTKSPYHKPEDEAELIDYDGLAEVTDHITVVTTYFAHDAKAVASGRKAFKHRNRSRGIEFGVTAVAGTNFFNYTSGDERGKTAASYGAGLYTQMNFNYFGIRPEIRYERSGARNSDGKLWMNSIVTPLSFVVQTPRNLVAGLYVSAGGYYKHMFSGQQKGNSDYIPHIYHRNDFGAQWSVGIWAGRINMALEKRYGCIKLLKDAGAGPNYKNRTTHFTMSYTF